MPHSASGSGRSVSASASASSSSRTSSSDSTGAAALRTNQSPGANVVPKASKDASFKPKPTAELSHGQLGGLMPIVLQELPKKLLGLVGSSHHSFKALKKAIRALVHLPPPLAPLLPIAFHLSAAVHSVYTACSLYSHSVLGGLYQGRCCRRCELGSAARTGHSELWRRCPTTAACCSLCSSSAHPVVVDENCRRGDFGGECCCSDSRGICFGYRSCRRLYQQ